MTSFYLMVVSMFGLALAGAAQAATQVECHALLHRADANADGIIDTAELKAILPASTYGLMAEPATAISIKPQDFEENCMLDRLEELSEGQ
jgi:hypothetical protein